MLQGGMRTGVSSVVSHGMRNDHIAEGASASSILYLKPDLLSAYLCPEKGSIRVEIMTSFVDASGSPALICARSKLAKLTSELRTDYSIAILLGFEIEVVFMRPVDDSNSEAFRSEQLGDHSWCNLTLADTSILEMIEEAVRKLSTVNAAVEKFHAESAPGQWEFVLSPRTPVEAVDMLLRARETITVIAHQYGLRATLHPRPFPEYAGTGAHTRKCVAVLSINFLFTCTRANLHIGRPIWHGLNIKIFLD
jgi:glutamine synthetase